MKLFKYQFIQENLGTKDGEIIELDPTVYDLNFALTLKSLGMFEEEYGKPLVTVIFGDNSKLSEEGSELGNPTFIKALACSMYVKLEDNQVLQNEATREEFKGLEIYKSCAGDLMFVGNLIKTATTDMQEKISKQVEEQKQNSKN